ncbi:MAG: 4-hydroxy-tetrahydrodipicolinate synthase [Magnetococcales bacterium]|nr:4-hydroxy-tetrahydrodipicolinate synthase [Magnetococcales bacterium]
MFEGVISALVTPFRDDQVDSEALTRLIEYQIRGGVNGIVPCGTTGESATLTHDEHRQVIQLVVEQVAGRVPVIAGTGSNSTKESIELTRFAQKIGATGALLITPYYNKPTQEGLYLHYRSVAEAVELPIVLYNVPGRTAVDMKAETVARLAKVKNITAIKEATGDMERASRIRLLTGDGITLISGDDSTFLPFLAVGGRGAISVTANIAPERMSALWRAWERGDPKTARQEHESLLELNRLLFCETNPIPIKAAVNWMGMCGPEIRPPLTPLAHPEGEALRQAMVDLQLLSGAGD